MKVLARVLVELITLLAKAIHASRSRVDGVIIRV